MPNVAAPALACIRGEDRTYTLTHQTSATDTTAINITGFTISATISKTPITSGGSAVITKVGTVTNGAAGTYTVALAHADTLIDPGSYILEIWRTDSGSKTQMALGTLTVGPDVLY